MRGELLEEARVTVEQQLDVVDPVEQHRHPVDAEAIRKNGVRAVPDGADVLQIPLERTP